MPFLVIIFVASILLGTLGCSKQAQNAASDLTIEEQIEAKLVATGGVAARRGVCPSSIYDTIEPLDSLHPAPKPGEPEMTIEGIQRFIEQNQITKMAALLNAFPLHFRTNFSLVEHTRATGESNLQFPRIVLFGSDGRFLLNVGTKPDDPKYNLLDVMELDEATGRWEMSVFDFSGETPTLKRHDQSCNECHGNENSRPVWGTNLMWEGVFGDNVSPRPQGEALDTKHMERMNEIKAGEGGSPRFDFLVWDEEPLRRGGKRKIAHHDFGAELILSNIAMGSATARGAYMRLINKYPEKFLALREAILYSYYLDKGNALINPELQKAIENIKTEFNLQEFNLDNLLLALGLDTNEAFSLATLFELEEHNNDWSMGRGNLHDMLMLQILDGLRRDNPVVEQILKDRIVQEAVFECPDTAKNINELVEFKMLHLFYLQGSARFEVNKYFYPLANEDIYDRVFIPIAHNMLTYLRSNITPSG